ncbi:MAG: grpE [Paucimonas sp.]|nr:grpE [Paucimonas sp.]
MQNQDEQRNGETQPELMAQPAQSPQSAQSAQSAQETAQGDADCQPLVDRLAQAESLLAETQDAFLRAKADVENIRRRAQADLVNAQKYAVENFAESMIPVKDSLEMALMLDKPTVESLKEGVEMTLRQMSQAFEKNRLSEVNPQRGERFDPERQQAMTMVPSDLPPNTVVDPLRKGYYLADRLLRPALVTVAQQKPATQASHATPD